MVHLRELGIIIMDYIYMICIMIKIPVHVCIIIIITTCYDNFIIVMMYPKISSLLSSPNIHYEVISVTIISPSRVNPPSPPSLQTLVQYITYQLDYDRWCRRSRAYSSGSRDTDGVGCEGIESLKSDHPISCSECGGIPLRNKSNL